MLDKLNSMHDKLWLICVLMVDLAILWIIGWVYGYSYNYIMPINNQN